MGASVSSLPQVVHDGGSSVESPSTDPGAFAGAIVINLDRRPDRLAAFAQALKDTDLASLTTRRFSAIDAKHIPHGALQGLLTPVALRELQMAQRTGMREHHSQLTLGAVGCYLSHVQVWHQIAAASSGPDVPWLVFEDDAAFQVHDVQSRLALFFQQAVEAFELRFGPVSHVDNRFALVVNATGMCKAGCRASIHATHPAIVNPYLAYGLHCYALTPRMAAKLLLLRTPPVLPIDVQLDTFLSMHPAVVFATPSTFTGSPVGQSGSPTDIQTHTLTPFLFR